MDDCIESDIVFKWTNCCRLCLSTEVEIDIFQSETVFNDVSAKLETYLNALVYRGDPMPRKICQSCWHQLGSWEKFRRNCLETETNLKKRLQPYRSLGFVQEFIEKDEAFHATLVSNHCQDAKSGNENNSPATTSFLDVAPPACQEPAVSTNSIFLGLPIKLEPIDEVIMSETVSNSLEKSGVVGEESMDLDPHPSILGSSVGVNYSREHSELTGEGSTGSYPDEMAMREELNDPLEQGGLTGEESTGLDSLNDFEGSTEDSNGSQGNPKNSGEETCSQENALAILRQMADGMGGNNADSTPMDLGAAEQKLDDGPNERSSLQASESNHSIMGVNENNLNESMSRIETSVDNHCTHGRGVLTDGSEIMENSFQASEKDGIVRSETDSITASNDVAGQLKVKTNLGYGSVEETETRDVVTEKECEIPGPILQWSSACNPGLITSVKGSADAVWQAQPSSSSPWLEDSILQLKEEPMSPQNKDPVDTNNQSGDKAYNLRPRVETILNYGEVEDWLEEVDTPPPRPSRLKVTPWKCAACQLYFKSSSVLATHQSSHVCLGKTMESFSCKVCSRKFFSECDLAEHNIIHLKIAYNLNADELRSCVKCDLSFGDPLRWQQHLKMHALKRMPSQATQYPCLECGLVFIKKTSYEEHRISHIPLNTPTRTIRSAQQNSRIATSVNSAHVTLTPSTPLSLPSKTERDYACSLCIERFKSEDLLYDHRFAFHGIPDERVACSTCLVKFRGALALEEHMRTHHTRSVARKTTKPFVVAGQPHNPERPVKALDGGSIRCRRCGHLFSSHAELALHEASKHKNATPYWCRKCGRRFPTRSLLLLHHRTHSSVVTAAQPEISPAVLHSPQPQPKQPLRCHLCHVEFQDVSDLMQHKASHDKIGSNVGIRYRHLDGHWYRYQCSGCPQMFSARESLARHLVHIHTGEKLNFLELKSPARTTSLEIAKSITTTIECNICHLKLTSQASLNFHMKKKHSKAKVQETKREPRILPEKKKVSRNSDFGQEICPYCSGTFSASYIQRHIIGQHAGSRTLLESSDVEIAEEKKKKRVLKCRYCSRVCNTSYNLLRHESTHAAGSSDWVCSCGRSFMDKNKYVKHRSICRAKPPHSVPVLEAPPTPPKSAPPQPTTADASTQHTCSICLNFYETQSLLELHVMTAHGLSTFRQATPVRERELWREEGNKIVRDVGGHHRCTLCRVHFDNLETAAWHRAQHPRGNLYVVQIDDSLYQCTVCDHLFNGRENALKHAEHHAEDDVKPTPSALHPQTFNCPFCSSQFNSEDSIRSHIFYVHPGGSANSV